MRKMIAFISALLLFPAMALAMSGPVEYEVNGQPYQGYYITPSKAAPFVLLIHDWDGLTDYEVKRAQMLAELGYSVFAADLFGKGVRPTEVKDKKQLTGALYQDREKMRALMYGALKKAKQLGLNTDNGVAIGYCFGGAAVLEFARSGADLRGFVSFHGGLTTPEGQNYTKTKGYVLVLHGTADTSVTMDDFADLAEELEETGVTHEMTTYSGAPHAFTVFGSKRYHEGADKLSWARFIEFLNAITQ
ncbi:dienelactone hydrolase family protein [Pseudodesulfovibrio sp. zrk46]|uniref:dienelactone hydrolase family protein n=1 Tax=Pseudodesulfovibrio sp. zrk46 TaxID=2725288 RepID=UPI00144961BF|nr:dienelactone hydrolase family protein [Pseudodesulfovibrio sp. zrk46]QJB55406.1 dienelactone hydrolase family protein [Pseudodesulfovibrio sp. zrk46]